LKADSLLMAESLSDMAESLSEMDSALEAAPSFTALLDAKDRHQVRLVFASLGAKKRTYIHKQFVTYPFHVCRAYYKPKDPPGMATLCLQSTSGGIFESDRTGVAITLEENSQAHVTTAAATVVHRMEKDIAQQKVSIAAGPGAFCEYAPGALILFPKANLVSSIDVIVDPSATVIFSDSFMTHNPHNNGETFTSLHTDVCVRDVAGEVLVRDRAHLTGPTFASDTPGITGKYKAQATLMVINQKIAADSLVSMLRAGLLDLEDVYCGVSTLPSDAGVWIRMLAVDGASLKQGLDLTWKLVREFMVDALQF
jgi:urease accessory protein